MNELPKRMFREKQRIASDLSNEAVECLALSVVDARLENAAPAFVSRYLYAVISYGAQDFLCNN